MKWIERTLKVAFNKLGLEISKRPRKRVIDYWNEDEQFVALAKQVREHTLIHEERLFMLYQFASSVVPLNGNVAELGVYKGGSAKLLAKIFERSTEKKRIFLFDTFCGMPEANPTIDLHKKGDFSDTSLESAQKFLCDCQDVIFYKGLFSDTLVKVADETFCFVHIDCDIYQSVLECCEFFYPRVIPCGVMVFDDYGVLSCPGVKKAVDDYFLDKIERPIYLPAGQCVIKRHV